MGQILNHDVAGPMRRDLPKNIPSVILGRLAIASDWQGKGGGRGLLAHVMRRPMRAADEVAARLVLVHAISARAKAFYLHHGFARLPIEAPILAIDLIKYKALLERQ